MLIYLKSVDSTDYNPEKVMNYNYFALQQCPCVKFLEETVASSRIMQKEENRPATHSKHLLQVHSNLLVRLTGIKDSLVLHHQ